MRYLPLLLLVACGAPEKPGCTATSCPTGRYCKGGEICDILGGAGGGRAGAGGGSGGFGGGMVSGTGGGVSSAGGGQGGGGSSANVNARIRFKTTSCATGTCDDCSLGTTECNAIVSLNRYNALRANQYIGCSHSMDATGYIIDCSTNCNPQQESCTTQTGDVMRTRYVCVPLELVDYNKPCSGGAWSP